MPIARFTTGDSATPSVGYIVGESVYPIADATIESLLQLGAADLVAAAATAQASDSAIALDTITLLPPIDSQEVWAAGVTYLRSRDARMEESTQEDVYDLVYEAERPELFMKGTASRVSGTGTGAGAELRR